MSLSKRNLTGIPGNKLRAEDFEPFVDEKFEFVRSDGYRSEVELVDVIISRYESNFREHPGFTMIFWEGGAESWAQGTHSLKHPECGELTFFMTPTDPREAKSKDGKGVCYQLLIN